MVIPLVRENNPLPEERKPKSKSPRLPLPLTRPVKKNGLKEKLKTKLTTPSSSMTSSINVSLMKLQK